MVLDGGISRYVLKHEDRATLPPNDRKKSFQIGVKPSSFIVPKPSGIGAPSGDFAADCALRSHIPGLGEG
jgi:hypothetical protein